MIFQPGTIARTGYGTKVEIVHVLPAGQEADGDALIGVMTYGDGSREICSWRRDGRFRKDKVSRLDLEPVPVRAVYPASDIGHIAAGEILRFGRAE